MTFEAFFAAAKERLSHADVSGIPGRLAFRLTSRARARARFTWR